MNTDNHLKKNTAIPTIGTERPEKRIYLHLTAPCGRKQKLTLYCSVKHSRELLKRLHQHQRQQEVIHLELAGESVPGVDVTNRFRISLTNAVESTSELPASFL